MSNVDSFYEPEDVQDDASDAKQPEFLCVASIRARGWSSAMVPKFLGEPHRLAPNPQFQCAAPMRLYYFERVLEEERKQEVIAALKTAAKRRNARKLVVQEQTENLLALVARMKVKVRACSRERLIAAAIRAYNDHHWEDIESAHIGSDPAFLTRIQVNYVRHQLTDYDARLESVASRVGVRKAEDAIREKVYAAIGAAYPEFKDECAAQLKRRREMDHYAWAAWQ